MNKVAKTDMMSQDDRISELPEHILHKIFSLVPPEEAMATTALSSLWRDMWISLPCLNLGKEFFHQQVKKKLAAFPATVNRPQLRVELKKQFLDFVDQTLMRRSKLHPKNNMGSATSFVRSLHLYMPNCLMTPETSARLDNWIDHAINNLQVEELDVYNDFAKNAIYKLPGHVFAASLSLVRCLSLSKVELDQEMVECLASSCPVIERLCLDCCVLFHALKVSGFSKLDVLVVHSDIYLTNIVIDVPNLGSLDYHRGCVYHQHKFAIGCGIQIELTAHASLRYLRINGAICNGSPELQAVLSKVEHFVLENCRLSGNFFISSNCLKSCTLTFYSLVNIKVDAPNLRNATISGSEVSSFEIKYSALEKGSFTLDCVTADDLVEYLTMLKLNPCEELELQFFELSEDLTISTDLREASNSLLYDVKHLMLKTGRHLCGWVCEILDPLLWLCPNPQTISISLGNFGCKMEKLMILKFKYFKQGEKGANKCTRCKSLPGLCWQHYIQEVSVRSHRGADANAKPYKRRGKAKAKDYDRVKAFFENAREVEKIVVNIIS